jgi:hypothetical protein
MFSFAYCSTVGDAWINTVVVVVHGPKHGPPGRLLASNKN